MLGRPRGLAELRQGFGACQSFEFKPHGTEGVKLLMLRASPQGEETAPRGQFRGTWLDCQHSDSAFRRGKSRNGHARPPRVPKGRILQGGTLIKGLAGAQRVSSKVSNLASRGRLKRPHLGLAPRYCMPRWEDLDLGSATGQRGGDLGFGVSSPRRVTPKTWDRDLGAAGLECS